jgi:hypothetical protein
VARRGVQGLLVAHADQLGGAATSGARQDLDAQVEELEVHLATQSGSDLASRWATQTKTALRQVLRHEHMAPIARIAEAKLPPAPGHTPLRMPPNSLSTEALHAAAAGMADTAEPHSAVFITAGLPQDFIAQLRNAAAAMRVPIDERTRSRAARGGATEGLSKEVQNARRTVRMLDALVSVALKDDPALLRSWNMVKRPPVKPGRPTGSTALSDPAAPSPAPSPTPAPLADAVPTAAAS